MFAFAPEGNRMVFDGALISNIDIPHVYLPIVENAKVFTQLSPLGKW